MKPLTILLSFAVVGFLADTLAGEAFQADHAAHAGHRLISTVDLNKLQTMGTVQVKPKGDEMTSEQARDTIMLFGS
jgi:hypothetical protein